jgi:hypothetical protein
MISSIFLKNSYYKRFRELKDHILVLLFMAVLEHEIYFEKSLKSYLKSFLNKLRIALYSILRKDFIVFSKSQNHLGSHQIDGNSI